MLCCSARRRPPHAKIACCPGAHSDADALWQQPARNETLVQLLQQRRVKVTSRSLQCTAPTNQRGVSFYYSRRASATGSIRTQIQAGGTVLHPVCNESTELAVQGLSNSLPCMLAAAGHADTRRSSSVAERCKDIFGREPAMVNHPATFTAIAIYTWLDATGEGSKNKCMHRKDEQEEGHLVPAS